PYASERDIIDFVRLNYKSNIKPIQESYATRNKLKIGSFRKRKHSVEERDDFIYRNKHLSQLKIKALVKERFGITLDYPYIGKIISRERKNRQKV
ncbi:MAG: hypothetical protein Q8N90_00225, partial [bacterium]|nr:hypothetical protein [bacterium]